MGCLFFPFMFLKWAFTHSWKGLVVLAIVVVIGIVGFNVVKGAVSGVVSPEKPTPAPTIVYAGMPSVKEAPFKVTTSSRYYLAAKAVQKDGITTMTGYWELNGEEWVKQGSLVLGKQFGAVTITKRK